MVKINMRTTATLLLLCSLGVILISGTSLARPRGAGDAVPAPEVNFHNAREQTREFMQYHNTIQLSAGERKIMEEALSSLPAPCCDNYSALSCCCPCNLARSIWGLSHYLIREHDYTAEPLRDAVMEWLLFVNPQGHSGQSCYVGKCNTQFAFDGCGGMNEETVVW